MRILVKKILYLLAKLTLAKYRPRVVAITGSVGKTSTKEAIKVVLESSFSVRANEENYNNEYGVPLTILGEKTGGKNFFKWVWIFAKGLVKLLSSSYPRILILELGTDRPGDITYLVDLIGHIDAAVLTDIGISHLEFFASIDALAKEKLSLIKKLPKESCAILNFDNPKILSSKDQTKAYVLGYGSGSTADLMVSDIQLIKAFDSWGTNFKVHFEGTVVPFFLPRLFGKPAVLASAAAALVGLQFKLNLVQISQALKNFEGLPGRLRLLAGIKKTSILDDTYNSAPSSSQAALEALNLIAAGRKLAAIGEMRELGSKTASGYLEVAVKINQLKLDAVFLVGENCKILEDELKKANFSGNIQSFATADEAGIPIQNYLMEGDTILVKGSQAMRMERIVKEIMAEPQKAPELLVRQSESWLNKP